jgi:hypothetical protein
MVTTVAGSPGVCVLKEGSKSIAGFNALGVPIPRHAALGRGHAEPDKSTRRPCAGIYHYIEHSEIRFLQTLHTLPKD